jgi:hypothetical protein
VRRVKLKWEYGRTGQGVLERNIRVDIVDGADIAKLLLRPFFVLVLFFIFVIFLVTTLRLLGPLTKTGTLLATPSTIGHEQQAQILTSLARNSKYSESASHTSASNTAK